MGHTLWGRLLPLITCKLPQSSLCQVAQLIRQLSHAPAQQGPMLSACRSKTPCNAHVSLTSLAAPHIHKWWERGGGLGVSLMLKSELPCAVTQPLVHGL